MTLIAWILANKWAWKLLLYAGLIAGSLLVFRWWLNGHDDKVYQQGKTAAAVELEKAKAEEWKAKEQGIADAYVQVAREREQLEADRAAMNQTLNYKLNQIRDELKKHQTTIVTIPSGDLDSGIRSVSAELAADR